MGFFESLFYTIWRGLAIGILISAPMGPVGILCIQRTLDKGRKTGLYTGIGAAISDLIYSVLTGFGLSFIEEFLERNQNVIQLAGSVILIAFAIYLFKKNPASSLKTPQEVEHVSPHKNILGGFLFTFSNPLILFLIIGLFARFNFSIPEISFYYYIAGYVAIFCGCVLWWEFVTFLVNKLRAHFNLRSMWLINKIIGGIILLFAIVGIITGISNLASAETLHFNRGRGYLPFKYATTDGIVIDNPTDTVIYDYQRLPLKTENFTIDFRAKNLNGDPTKKYKYITQGKKEVKVTDPNWGFFITGETDTLVFNFKKIEKVTAIETQPAIRITVLNLANGSEKKVDVTENINRGAGDNLYSLRITSTGTLLKGGYTGMKELLSLPGLRRITGYGFYSGSGGKVAISDISLEYSGEDSSLPRLLRIQDFEDYLAKSKDDKEGYWVVYDRDLEENLIKLGGNYKLACRKEGDNYILYYIEGASVNPGSWHPGETKAILSPTAFPGVYDVVWYDAMKQPIAHDIQAQSGEGNTLAIQFPYQTSRLRLRKLPQ